MLSSMVTRAGFRREREVSFSSEACSFCCGRDNLTTRYETRSALSQGVST